VLDVKELPYDEDALPSACPTALLEAMKACLNFAPAARPRFSQLAQDLGSSGAVVTAYLEALTITPEVWGPSFSPLECPPLISLIGSPHNPIRSPS